MYKLIYHGTVVSKKNAKRAIRNHRTGRLGVVLSPAARANQDDIINQFRLQRPKQQISPPLLIRIDMFEPDHHRRDLDNQATSIMDALTKARIIEDDGIKFVHELAIRFAGVDRKNPRAEIFIEHKEVADDKNRQKENSKI